MSALLWLPVTGVPLRSWDPSLRWVLDLPTPAFAAVLGRALAAAAARVGDGPARGWWRVVVGGAVLTALLPAAVYGAGAVALALPAVVVAVATLVTAVVLCLAHAGRPWASPPSAAGGAG